MSLLPAALAAFLIAALFTTMVAVRVRRDRTAQRELLTELGRLYAEIDALQARPPHQMTSAEPELKPLLREILGAAVAVLGCEAGTASCDLDRWGQPVVVSIGTDSAMVSAPLMLSVGPTPDVEIVATRLVENAELGVGRQVLHAALLREPDVEAVLTAYQAPGREPWTPQSLADLEQLIAAYRPALATARRLEVQRRQAERSEDVSFEEAATAELRRAERHRRPVAMVCVSSDAGELPEPRLRAGDRAEVRRDVLTVLLVETGFAGARRWFDRIAGPSTCSAGIAEAFPGEGFEGLHQRALGALSSARRSGGGRAMIAAGPCERKETPGRTIS